jgi:ferritin-like metal-binding protein YciE
MSFAMSRVKNELVRFLKALYSLEQQASSQLALASITAGDARLASDLRQHSRETEGHSRRLRERLVAHGAPVSGLRGTVMKLGAKAPILLKITQPEMPRKLIVHSFSYEAMEWAGYEILARLAQFADDDQTVSVASAIRDEKRAMMNGLEHDFDRAEKASHKNKSSAKTGFSLQRHLREMHALENRSANLLMRAKTIGKDPQFSGVCQLHFEQALVHARLLKGQIESAGGKRSRFANKVLALGGWTRNLSFRLRANDSAKIAIFIYAHEQLKTANYALLQRTAKRAENQEVQDLSQKLGEQQRLMADRVAGTFDSVVEGIWRRAR